MKKTVSIFLTLTFVFSNLSYAAVSYDAKLDALKKAYKRVSIVYASDEFTQEERAKIVEEYQVALVDNEITQEEFEEIAKSQEWVSENTDFSKVWKLAQEGNQKELTKLFVGQTGNQWGFYPNLHQSQALVACVFFVSAAAVIIALN